MQWNDLSDDVQLDEIAWEWHITDEIASLMDRYVVKKKLTAEVHALMMTKMWGL